MNRTRGPRLALAALLALPIAHARGQPPETPRFVLDGPVPEGHARAGEVARFVEQELTRSGWRDGVPDVRARLSWSFDEPRDPGNASVARWCAKLQAAWWDREEPSVEACASSPEYWVQPAAPTPAVLKTRISVPFVEALRAQQSERWLLRVRRPSEASTPKLLVGGKDAGAQVEWVENAGALRVARGNAVEVRAGRCRMVARETAEVDVAALTSVRHLVPSWTVAGRASDRIAVDPGQEVEVTLRLEDPPYPGAALDVPCAGDIDVKLDGADVLVTPGAHAGHVWNWSVQPNAGATKVLARVRAAFASDEAVAQVTVPVTLPWWSALWAFLNTAVGKVAALLGGVAAIVAAVRRITGKKHAD
jgi:hypothetical protein